MERGAHAKSIEGLSVSEAGDLLVEVLDTAGKVLCVSNPLRIAAETPLRSYWCDLHGQSEETIGTNSARELIEFARDRAFLAGRGGVPSRVGAARPRTRRPDSGPIAGARP